MVTRPNVLLIHCHDLGRYLGCYGADVDTPRIDSFAESGALFEHQFVSAPQCTPSRGSLMTGRYPHVNGLMGLAHGNWNLDDDERILPQYLGDAGYETHLFGLQHIAQDTERLEYDHVHSEQNLYPGVSPAVHLANRAENVASAVSSFLESEAETEADGSAADGSAADGSAADGSDADLGGDAESRDEDDVEDERRDENGAEDDGATAAQTEGDAEDERQNEDDAEDERQDTPFFASVGFFELHRVEGQDGRFGFDPGHYETDDPDEVRPLSYLPDRWGIRHDLAEMHGMVYAVDEAFGSILDTLEATGLSDETLVVFTTEHGIAFPRAKGSCYDAGIEAALLARYPGVADDGTRYDELLANVDLLPTILDLVDVDVPDHLDGRSFLPLLTGGDYDEREHVFAEMTWHDMYNPVRAIRTERYKYVRNFWHLPSVYLSADVFASEAGREVRETYSRLPRPYEELYDLQEAPQEDDNVVFEPRYQDVRVDLARQLEEWMTATDDPLLDGPVVPADFDDVQAWPHETDGE